MACKFDSGIKLPENLIILFYNLIPAMENISLSVESSIATVTFIRSAALNALNTKTFDELNLVLNTLEEKDDVRVVLLTGDGRAFVAGADIAEMHHMSSKDAARFSEKGQQTFKRIEDFEKPVIAVVNGYALGGGFELALACDFIIASEKAKFSAPEVNLGLIPGFCGTYRLNRIVGHATAKYLILTTHTLDAQEALRLNLVHKVIAHEDLMSEAMSIAKAICLKSTEAVGASKEVLRQNQHMSYPESASLEREQFAALFEGDGKEGMAAFLEKRNPVW